MNKPRLSLLLTLSVYFLCSVLKAETVEAARKWSCQADVDISGRSGSTHSSGLSLGFSFEGKAAADVINGSVLYARESSGEDLSADDLGTKLAYETAPVNSHFWYARTHTGYERAKGISFFSVNSLGAGYRLITFEKGQLDALLGLAHRTERYTAASEPGLSSPSVDAGIIFSNDLKWAVIDTTVTYVPAVEDFSDYILKHETVFNLLKNPNSFSLKLGMSNEYRSRPQPSKEKLDTTYFARLSYEWN